IRIAGARVVDSGSSPYSRATCTSAAGRPGMPADHGPLVARSRSSSPSSSRKAAGVADAGAVSRASTNTSRPLSASCSSKNPPPPSPELIGSTTDNVDDTATAASKALPPARMISMPASVASEWALAIAAPGGVGAAAVGASARAGAVAAHPASRPTRKPAGCTGRIAWCIASYWLSRALLQAKQLGQQLLVRFGDVRVGVDALDRTD